MARTRRTAQVRTRICFDAGDLEETLRRVAQLGGTVERSRTHLGGGDRWFASFTKVPLACRSVCGPHTALERDRPDRRGRLTL